MLDMDVASKPSFSVASALIHSFMFAAMTRRVMTGQGSYGWPFGQDCRVSQHGQGGMGCTRYVLDEGIGFYVLAGHRLLWEVGRSDGKWRMPL